MNNQSVAGLKSRETGILSKASPHRKRQNITPGGHPIRQGEAESSLYRMQPGPAAVCITCWEPESLAECAVKTEDPAGAPAHTSAHASAHWGRSGPHHWYA